MPKPGGKSTLTYLSICLVENRDGDDDDNDYDDFWLLAIVTRSPHPLSEVGYLVADSPFFRGLHDPHAGLPRRHKRQISMTQVPLSKQLIHAHEPYFV